RFDSCHAPANTVYQYSNPASFTKVCARLSTRAWSTVAIIGVIAEVKLTHPRRSNFDPPGRGWRLFSSRRDVDPGASGGDQGIRTTRALDSADHARDGAVA